MNSITEFKRDFSRVMRGYNPDEVDAAVEMLVSYGAELESANGEFAEVNDSLIAQNDELAAGHDRLAAENNQLREDCAAAQSELAQYLEKYGEAKALLLEARKKAEMICAEAETKAAELRAKCAAEEKRYAALCRRTRTLTEAVTAIYTEQMPAIEALAESLEEEAPVQEEIPREEPDNTRETERADIPSAPPLMPQRPQIRRAAMAAAALDDEPAPVPAREARRAPQPAPFKQAQPEVKLAETPTAAPVIMHTPEPAPQSAAEQRPTIVFPVQNGGVPLAAEVYNTSAPPTVKITRADSGTERPAPTHSYAAVRRTLEEIGSRMK